MTRRGAMGRSRWTRGVEALEGRELMATFAVTSLAAKGAGSLREAILLANRTPGADTVRFDVAGTIRNGPGALPKVTDAVTIDGSTAPGYAGSPVVTVDFQGKPGLTFAAGSDGSTLRGLALVRAGGAGVTLVASRVAVENNSIGLRADGRAAGNRGDGVRIAHSSSGNRIGTVDPITGIDFYNASGVSIQPVTAWQGIRAGASAGQYLLAGTSGSTGLLYEGPITGVGGTTYAVNVPGATATSVYGPDLLENGAIRLVGSFKTGAGVVNGFLYRGTKAGLDDAANYRTIDYPGAKYTYVHSVMGDLAVGNADGPEGNAPLGTGHAFLYGVTAGSILAEIAYPGATTTTAYGIWLNGEDRYTICGGFSGRAAAPGAAVSGGYLVDYDARTGTFRNWTPFEAPDRGGVDLITHFEGISGTEKGVYTLVADSVRAGSAEPVGGSFVTVRREPDGSFGAPAWVDLNDPNNAGVLSANSVAGNQVVGIVAGSAGVASFQATVNTGFRLSNVIGGNGGNGITIDGSDDNQVAMNFIGTDRTGTRRRANGGSGIVVTRGAARNLIGGQATGGNDPTAGVFVRPPQGNLISGNRGNGVLIERGATATVLSGNFIGTVASGNAALGNRLDGVRIDRANGNALIGCTFRQDPFVFYNVVSGNGGNGVWISNSNDTTIQANFMGTGADNASIVANGGNGLLVSGTSRNVQNGGVIPLGGVFAGNRRNGIEIKDRASGVLTFNAFAGLYAFGGAAPNRRNGILITSTGGNNTVRTSIASGNLGNGIEIGGNATGVQVTETAAGTNTSIKTPLPNQGSGIVLSGRAHGNLIGGAQLSIVPQLTLSSNRRYGVEVRDSAFDNTISRTFIGTNFNGTEPLGNTLGGILLDRGTSGTVVGGDTADLQTRVQNNGGNGVTIRSSRRNRIFGNPIGNNAGVGLLASGNCAGTIVQGNTITNNGQGDVDVSRARGILLNPI